MKIGLVAALSRNQVIGRDNALPWHLPADLKRFKAITLGKPIIMGRKTYDSIGRPLPGRHNIVITRNPEFTADGVTVVESLDAALDAANHAPEVMVIGGANIYYQFLPRADWLYLTVVHTQIDDGDAFFPAYNRREWRLTREETHPADEQNPYPHSFMTWQRITTRSA
ncbi:MAG: dihydrofolate reductase [Halothiobacillus sp. 20-53-49]|nr:MAG: dihydrofolate reductase [Halothiobacillus sp. 20-53-49]HUN00287.1 type 3 dihydrofolate reductase [Halothiobacillus sp.]